MKRTIKEYVEPKTFEDKALFDDFKDSIGGRCFNKDSVYRWVYKLTDIKPTDDEIYEIMDKWVKNKWAYKKENERTGANFYYFELKETVSESKKIVKENVIRYRVYVNDNPYEDDIEDFEYAKEIADKCYDKNKGDVWVDEYIWYKKSDYNKYKPADEINEKYKSFGSIKNEGRKNMKRIMKEEKEIKLLNSIDISTSFSEIGYFGEGTWNDAMGFSKNNSKGWRLPTEKEAGVMNDNYHYDLKYLCNKKEYCFFTNKENKYDNDFVLVLHRYADNDSQYQERIKTNNLDIFLVR